MATVIVRSDIDPKIEIRISEFSENEWGGKCPRCRALVTASTTVTGGLVGRAVGVAVAIRHLDANCG